MYIYIEYIILRLYTFESFDISLSREFINHWSLRFVGLTSVRVPGVPSLGR